MSASPSLLSPTLFSLVAAVRVRAVRVGRPKADVTDGLVVVQILGMAVRPLDVQVAAVSALDTAGGQRRDDLGRSRREAQTARVIGTVGPAVLAVQTATLVH